ncbi:MAG: mycothiol synthase [Stackebrandtia sp.]
METYEGLDAAQVAEVLELVEVGDQTDGLAALNEQTLLNLRHGGPESTTHLMIRDAEGALVGYANMDTSDTGVAAVEMLVHPMHRHRGHGETLLRALIARAADASCQKLTIWAHGDHPTALVLADRHDFSRARVLWQMRRPLLDGEPAAEPAEGITIRSFVPGRDEARLLEVNNAAFSDHPDQAGWTVRDVAMREREDWFDPEGLLLAERESDGTVLGFHWTKVHGSGESAIGEIYVLGVAPQAQGLKLGGALTAAGLRYLRGRGLDTVMLYVDESNVRAVRLYTRAGFTRWTTDVNYHKKL